MRILLDGDETKASMWIPWAKSRLFMLKSLMRLSGRTMASKRYDLNGQDVRIFVSSVAGQDEVRITAEGIKVTVFTSELGGVAPYYQSPQCQIWNERSFRKEFSDPDGLSALTDYRQYDVAYYKNFVYVTNWFNGGIEKYTADGKYVEHNHLGGAGAFEQLAVGSDRIALSSNMLTFGMNTVFVYDMAYTLRYNIPCDVNANGSTGLEIAGDKLYVAWKQEVYIPGDWHAFIKEYDLETGAELRVFEVLPSAGLFFEAISAYKGLLYATNTREDSIMVWNIEDGTVVKEFDTTGTIPPEVAPRGIAVGESGVWVTGFFYGAPAPSPNSASLYHYDLNLNLRQKLGSIGNGPGQFRYPFGVALMET